MAASDTERDVVIRLPKWALVILIGGLPIAGGGALLYAREQVAQPANQSDLITLTAEISNLRNELTAVKSAVQNLSYSMCEMKNDLLQDQGKAPRVCSLPTGR